MTTITASEIERIQPPPKLRMSEEEYQRYLRQEWLWTDPPRNLMEVLRELKVM